MESRVPETIVNSLPAPRDAGIKKECRRRWNHCRYYAGKKAEEELMLGVSSCCSSFDGFREKQLERGSPA